MDLDEGVCAGCGKALGIRANWRIANGGRAYHNDCDPPRDEGLVPDDPKNVENLSDFFERKARSAMHGRGARTLDQDAKEHNDDGD